MTATGLRRRAAEVFLLSGPSRAELAGRIAEVRDLVAQHAGAAPIDLAAAVNRAPADGDLRLAIVAATPADLDARLAAAAERIRDDGCTRIRERAGVHFRAGAADAGAIALVFPGEASQYPGMLADLCVHVPEARAWFDVLDRAALQAGRAPLSHTVFGPAGHDGGALWAMDAGAESVTAADMAMLEVVTRLGVVPRAVAGHSTGDWAALVAAGVFRLEHRDELADHVAALNACYRRLRDAGALPDAALLAVGAGDPALVRQVVERARGAVTVAMDNCPHQVVLCGEEGAVERARAELRRKGAVCQPLPFGRAYHTPAFGDFAEGIRGFLRGLPLGPPRLDVYSCATAARYPADPDAIREIMAAQWRQPVRFRETVEAMYAAGARVFVEVGPNAFLSGFVRDVLRGRPHVTISTDDPRRPGTEQLSHAVAQLAVLGVPLDLDLLYAGRARPLEEAGAGAAAGTRVRVATALPLLHLPPRRPAVAERRNGGPPAPPPAAPPPDARSGAAEPVIEAYLATMERFLATQREVMTAYLSGTAPPAELVPPVELTPPPAAPPPPAPSDPPPATPPVPTRAADAADLPALVRRLVADRTGYPPEMLDRPLDLEGDLGIDSIKRVEILAAIQQETGLVIDMERAGEVRTLDEVVGLLPATDEPASATAGAASAAAARPLLGEVTLLDGGRRLVAERRLSLATDPYLRDHALGGPVSEADPDLLGLPVLPLTMTVELMAQAAAALGAGERVVAVRDVRAHHWIALDAEETVLRVEAEREGDGASVVVRVDEGGSRAAEARVDLAPEAPPAPPAELGDQGPGGASPWPPDELYRHGMFHGPAFRGVAAIEGIDEEAIDGRLRGLPADTVPASGLLTDPVLLDAAGQLVGYWAAARLGRGFTVFPFSIDAVEVHGPALSAGAEVLGRARVAYEDGPELHADIRLAAPDGRLHARLRGWRDLRFHLPERFFDLRLSPATTFLGAELPVAAIGLPDDGSAAAVLVDDLSDAFLLGHGRIWMRVLAHLILGRREREEWAGLAGNDRRRAEWLRGRAAAKDAVRALVHGRDVFPADVEILSGEHGAPVVRCTWPGAAPEAPVVSIAHSGEVAIAAAAERVHRGVGVDVERPRPLPEGFAEYALAPEEQRLHTDGDERLLALWCAKESAAKAVGQGIGGDPRRLVVRSFDAETGVAEVDVARVTGAPDGSDGTLVRAHTTRAGELTIATAIRGRSRS